MIFMTVFTSNIPTIHYATARNIIKDGDILLCSGNGAYSRLIRWATNSEWSHVAFVLWAEKINRLMVMESVESIGVRTVPLSSYLHDYSGTGKSYDGRLMIARHKDFNHKNINNFSTQAVDLLGHNYGWSQIVKIATKIVLNRKTPEVPTPKKEFICSEYVYKCYKSIELNISTSPGYVSPADFANTPEINSICKLLIP